MEVCKVTQTYVMGVDVGTSSTKGVLVDPAGRVVAQEVRHHEVSRPRVGHVEMDPRVWWDEFRSISLALTDQARQVGGSVQAVGVSGMGPCVALVDNEGAPVRPAILYGVDTRATEEIAALTEELGRERIVARCGSALSTQAAGPKIEWVARHEPEIFTAASRVMMPASYLAFHLTGEYVLDHHSASQCTPLYDIHDGVWIDQWWQRIAAHLEAPALVWPHEVIGTVHDAASAGTGLDAGTPVIAGSIDAWMEAASVGATEPGDIMLMYGTTMFLIATGEDSTAQSDSLWTTTGLKPGTWCLAGGMATSGAITQWVRDLWGHNHAPAFETLLAEADASGPGARGLLMLPYFAGERTPIMDPFARGLIVGLTLEHGRGDLYRAALEATAMGVRHNIEAMRERGVTPRRVVAAGGGTQGELWASIVSHVTGLTQIIPSVTVGASYGAAVLAAGAVWNLPASLDDWNPPHRVVEPNLEVKDLYDELYQLYIDAYPAMRASMHSLAQRQIDGVAQ